MTSKPTKRIALVDAGENAEVLRAVLPFIAKYYDLQITQDRDADYVFHSCFGNEVLKYSGIRIFVTGEYVIPNFNASDYALGRQSPHRKLASAHTSCPILRTAPLSANSSLMHSIYISPWL
jgi:hypothetical protein